MSVFEVFFVGAGRVQAARGRAPARQRGPRGRPGLPGAGAQAQTKGGGM